MTQEKQCYCKDCCHWEGDYIKDLLKKCNIGCAGEELVDGYIFATAPFYSCHKFQLGSQAGSIGVNEGILEYWT